jgi:ABC-type sugar transport system ATPase subunit
MGPVSLSLASRPSLGVLVVDGSRANELRPAERGAAMAFQSYALYPRMTVVQNMGFVLKMAGVRRATGAPSTDNARAGRRGCRRAG